MKLIWLSDLHLEFVGEFQLRTLLDEIVTQMPDAVLITGDISNARRLEYHLGLLAELLPCPIYFLLGNHDFYHSCFAEVDALVQDICTHDPKLVELAHGEIIMLGEDNPQVAAVLTIP